MSRSATEQRPDYGTGTEGTIQEQHRTKTLMFVTTTTIGNSWKNKTYVLTMVEVTYHEAITGLQVSIILYVSVSNKINKCENVWSIRWGGYQLISRNFPAGCRSMISGDYCGFHQKQIDPHHTVRKK